jgi:hypothetical protein
MAQDTYPEFAESYLSGAALSGSAPPMARGGRLTPHTVTAYMRLKAKPQAMRVLERWRIKLVEPLPFGHADRRGV